MAVTYKDELACVYAALVLVDDDVAVTAEKIQTIIKAARVKVEPYWPSLFAKALDGLNLRGFITSFTSTVGVAPAPVPGAAVAAASAALKEEKKEETDNDSEDSGSEMGLDLFNDEADSSKKKNKKKKDKKDESEEDDDEIGPCGLFD